MEPPGTPTTPADKKADAMTSSATASTADPISKTDTEWCAQLTPEEYYVALSHGSERAGTSLLNHEKRDGAPDLRPSGT
jgi:hypothetical protein